MSKLTIVLQKHYFSFLKSKPQEDSEIATQTEQRVQRVAYDILSAYAGHILYEKSAKIQSVRQFVRFFGWLMGTNQ